jgi:hypothetical protein
VKGVKQLGSTEVLIFHHVLNIQHIDPGVKIPGPWHDTAVANLNIWADCLQNIAG